MSQNQEDVFFAGLYTKDMGTWLSHSSMLTKERDLEKLKQMVKDLEEAGALFLRLKKPREKKEKSPDMYLTYQKAKPREQAQPAQSNQQQKPSNHDDIPF